MQISFRYTPEILQRAHRLHYNKFFPLRGKVILYLGLLSAWAGLLLLLVKGGGRNLWYSVPLISYGIIAVILHFYLLRSVGKRAYKKLKEYHDPMLMEISGNDVSITILEDTTVISWSQFKKALVTDGMVLLYPSETVFFIYPRENFAEGEFDNFTKLVKEKIEKLF